MQTSINRWMDKQITVYPSSGILLGNKKEWAIDTHNNIDAFQNNEAE